VNPVDIAGAVREEADQGARRLLICGGDGTLSAAVGAAAGTALEIAAFPGGTLNHFARDFGIPLDDPATALDIAASGKCRPVDLGSVNGHVILNTSSVGAYPEFVRRREDLEQRLTTRWRRRRPPPTSGAILRHSPSTSERPTARTPTFRRRSSSWAFTSACSIVPGSGGAAPTGIVPCISSS
jgi:hypothetical protein